MLCFALWRSAAGSFLIQATWPVPAVPGSYLPHKGPRTPSEKSANALVEEIERM